jgi:hypothetical protein
MMMCLFVATQGLFPALETLPAQVPKRVADLVAVGDTAAAISLLRLDAATPAAQCYLATLLTAQASNRTDDWERRLEARQLLE